MRWLIVWLSICGCGCGTSRSEVVVTDASDDTSDGALDAADTEEIVEDTGMIERLTCPDGGMPFDAGSPDGASDGGRACDLDKLYNFAKDGDLPLLGILCDRIALIVRGSWAERQSFLCAAGVVECTRAGEKLQCGLLQSHHLTEAERAEVCALTLVPEVEEIACVVYK